jgi:hypothetical protein
MNPFEYHNNKNFIVCNDEVPAENRGWRGWRGFVIRAIAAIA